MAANIERLVRLPRVTRARPDVFTLCGFSVPVELAHV